MQKRLVKIECLVLAQNFQILWAYYVQSSAKLFEKECREAAVAFLASYDELTKINPKINYQIISKFGFKTGPNDLFRQHSGDTILVISWQGLCGVKSLLGSLAMSDTTIQMEILNLFFK